MKIDAGNFATASISGRNDSVFIPVLCAFNG